MLQALFDQAGVHLPLRLTNPDGTRLRDVEAVRWKTGDGMEVVALYGPLDDGRHQWRPREGNIRRARERDVPQSVRLELPAPKYVTQINTGQAYGQTRSVPLEIRPWRPTFLVLTERPLHSPALDPVAATVGQGDTLDLQIEVPGSTGQHALTVRATTPTGEPAIWFDQTVISSAEGATVRLPVATNEQPGTWRVEVRDLYTGKSAVSAVEIVR
jgi:hypothetical protein